MVYIRARSSELIKPSCTWDMDLWASKLCVIEEESSFGSTKKTISNVMSFRLMCLTDVSFSKVTVALCGLFGSPVAGETEREDILPLWWFSKERPRKMLIRITIPETEEVSYFLLTSIMANVLNLNPTPSSASSLDQMLMAGTYMNNGWRHDELIEKVYRWVLKVFQWGWEASRGFFRSWWEYVMIVE